MTYLHCPTNVYYDLEKDEIFLGKPRGFMGTFHIVGLSGTVLEVNEATVDSFELLEFDWKETK